MALVECYPIGVITMIDNGMPDDKIISIPFNDPTYSTYKDISQLPKHVFDECGVFHEGLRYSQDALMWDTIFLKGYSLVYNDDQDVLSRIHGKQLTQTGRSVFQKDSKEIGKILIPELIKVSDSKNNFLFYFAKRNAKNGNVNVVKMCVENGKKNRLIGIWHVAYLTIESIYGQIRPFLRKLYYKYFVRVKI
jgi:hypothetical protein